MSGISAFAASSDALRSLELWLRQLEQPENPISISPSALNEKHEQALLCLSKIQPRDLYEGFSLDELFQSTIVWPERLRQALEAGHYYCARQKMGSFYEDGAMPEHGMLLESRSPRSIENTLGFIFDHLKAAKRNTPENQRLVMEAALQAARRGSGLLFLRLLNGGLDPKDNTVPRTIRWFRQFTFFADMLTQKCYGADSEAGKKILKSLRTMRGELDVLVEKICPQRHHEIMPAGLQLQPNYFHCFFRLLGLKPR